MTCYRFRVKYGKAGQDFTKEVWEAGLVGIWFGSWDIQDLYDSYEAYPPKARGQVTKPEVTRYINDVLRNRGLPENMQPDFVSTIKTFDETLVQGSWVCTYFDGRLHLGQIADSAPHDEPRFNYNMEHFKARRVINCKSFDVALLPDAFRLLASAGQQTLHKFKNYADLAEILIDSSDEKAVSEMVAKLPLDAWFSSLGPKGWESICTGYLILEHDFLPAGLTVGGTLPDFDIVGRDLQGTPIYGQCKKDPGEYLFTDKDRESFERLPLGAKKFFFPFGGPDFCDIADVTIISYKHLAKWLDESPKGIQYKQILRPLGVNVVTTRI